MKKKKGFTLIELLAIIVILALIAVVVTPIILEIIEESKIGAAQDSAYGYKEAVGKYYANMLSQNHEFMLNGKYSIGSNGSISDGENTYDIAVSGTIPNSGYLNITNGIVTSGCIQINEYAVTIEDKKVSNTEKGNCVEVPVEVVVEEFPTVQDTNPGIICGDNSAEDYDNNSVCYIYSVEDLVAFSNMVNSGKNFQGKTVQLMNNLDIQNDKSYANVNSNQFGDVNENGTTSSTLKEELTDTESKGFKPIGNDTNKFSGTFEGNTKTIKSLYINRSTEDYVGLFGYNNGNIQGLKLTNANVTGNQYVGLIAGRNDKKITSTIIKGNVTGYQYVGLAVGYVRSAKVETIAEGNVTSTYNTENNKALTAGITGYIYTGQIRGVYLGGTVSITNGMAYKTIGDYSGNITLKTVVSNTVTAPTEDEGINKQGGYTVSQQALDNIAMLDAVLDTYIGGDKDQDDYSDGYYYDYDSNGNFTIFKLSDRPLNITMEGQGTAESPYLITNYDELKQVSYNLGTNGTNIYYRLDSDIDFTGKKSIMIGNDKNMFQGVFDGNAHTISNLTLIGYDYVGLFGYNNGIVQGLKLTNANVTGNLYVGIMSGRNDKKITSTIIKGNVTGYQYVGLAVGFVRSAKVEAMVEGNVTSTYNNENNKALAAGIVGFINSGQIRGVYLDGTVSVTNGMAYKTIGDYSNSITLKTIASNTVTAPTEDEGINKQGGHTAPQQALDNIAMLDAVLDTYIGGDKDQDDYSDGYYYDYDSNGNFTIFKISEKPLNITMEGQGTSESPYLITNYDELKQVSYNLGTNGTNIYYRLDSDIDFTGKKSIMIGNDKNKFQGVFDGNAHTISNLTLIGYDYVGLFGYNNGTIKGLTVTNANITGNTYIGIMTGRNDKTISNVILKGNVNGYQYLGLVSGYDRQSKIEAVVQGNVTSTYNSANNVALAGGITGKIYTGTINAMYIGGTVSVTNGIAYKSYGDYSGSTTIKTGVSNTVTAPSADEGINRPGGKTYTSSDLQTLAPYQEVGLNTSTASGEYRYALDSNHNPYLIKN